MDRKIKKTARVILEVESDVIFIHRIKRNKLSDNKDDLIEYYVTPGGHLEAGETFEQAAIREVYEELGINVKLEELFLSMYNKKIETEEKYYIASYVSGILGTGKGEEFDGTRQNFEEYGSYEIVKINKKELGKYNILSLELKEKLLLRYK